MTIFRECTGGWGGLRRKCCQEQIAKYLKTLCLLYLTIVSNGYMKCVHGNTVTLNGEIANVTGNVIYANRLTNQQISIESQKIAATESDNITAEIQSLSTTSGACSCKIAIVNKNSVGGVHIIDCIACQSDGKYEGINSTSNIDTDKRRQKPLKFKRTDEQQQGSFEVSKAEDIQKNELRSEDVVVVRHRRHSESVIDDATTDSVRGTMSLVEPTADDNVVDGVGGQSTSMSSNIQPNTALAAADSLLSPQRLQATAIITMAPTAMALSAETVDYSATTEEFFIKHVDMADIYRNFTQSTTTCSPDDENCIISLHNSTCVGEEIYCNYTYEEYVDMLYDYIYPTVPEWILIFSHAVVFFMGLVSTSILYIFVLKPFKPNQINSIEKNVPEFLIKII